MPLQQKPVNVVEGVQCYKKDDDRVRCRAAFGWPRRLIEAKLDDCTSPIGPMSRFPFRVNLNLDPIDDVSVGLLSGQTMTLTISEPLAHLRRDVEARNVRLADFAAAVK